MTQLPAYLRTTLIRQRWLAAAERFELALADREPDYPGEKKRALQSRLVRREAALAHAYSELAKLNVRFDPNQPRIPAGQPGAGQWTSGGGGVSSFLLGATTGSEGLNDAVLPYSELGAGRGDSDPNTISSEKPNYHVYTSGPNMVCTAQERCSHEDMADYLSRFAVPDQNPARPVRDKDVSNVFDPVLGFSVGAVTTKVNPDGLTVTNVTNDGHIFYYGQVERRAIRNDEGTWSILTRGTGNNTIPELAMLNRYVGPEIFDKLDRRMREYIQADRNAKKSIYSSWLRHSRHLSHHDLVAAHATGAAHAL